VIDPRKAFLEMEKAVSRRAFFRQALKGVAIGAGSVAAFDRFGPRLFGQSQSDLQHYDLGLKIVSAFGQMVIPVDQDSGWATFEPDITTYTLDVYIRQVFNLGVNLSYYGYLQAVAAFNTLPTQINYGPEFLNMDVPTRSQYLSDILIGNFETTACRTFSRSPASSCFSRRRWCSSRTTPTIWRIRTPNTRTF